MHNWWIASLEHFGLITREEAEHLADNIKLAIHKENYAEAYKNLEAILGDGNFKNLPLVKQLESELADLKDEVATLKEKAETEVTKIVAKPTKA